MDRVNYQQLCDYKFDISFEVNGELWFILSTDFSSQDYKIINNQYSNIDFPILLDDNGNPQIDDKGELLRDFTDEETLEYNHKQSLYRMASLLKLIVKNSDDIDNMNVDEIVVLLQSFSSEIFTQLEQKVNNIIETKFGRLREDIQRMSRLSLAFAENEKRLLDEQKKEISAKRDKLIKRQEELQILFRKCNDENKRKEYKKQIDELEKQATELRQLLVTDYEDGVKVENGVSSSYIDIDIFREYNLPYQLLKDMLNNTLSKEDEIVVQLIRSHYQLRGESEKRAYDKINNKPKGDGG